MKNKVKCGSVNPRFHAKCESEFTTSTTRELLGRKELQVQIKYSSFRVFLFNETHKIIVIITIITSK